MPQPSQVKSKQRVAAHGEVFTAKREVKAMCDLVADECNRIDSRFLEPACGEGAFLAEILTRKLAVCKQKYGTQLLRPDYERASVNAVMSLYGVELLPDNAASCRERLFAIWNDAYTKNCGTDAHDICREVVRYILSVNILCGDALTMKQDNGEPIIFAEWSFIDGSMVKRRDFRLDKLIEANEKQKGNCIPVEDGYVGYDWEKKEFFPKPIQPEYPPIDYRRLCEHGRS
ncbi:SAM-dependent DNA methyltransferase [Desulfovibrio sp. ZJ200]|uniref:SAM-dependent DNA methyltransferase n=1 Tax=Desulfovibrio sp. ZJ200 TaxID=2709792 RepID=UPI0013EDD8C3|nr:SAM-dependent DNA methyltransferase [Desulfovibrio sp. ZJ200]